jgi:uncharacterized repeat protein (TIGR03803 family)
MSFAKFTQSALFLLLVGFGAVPLSSAQTFTVLYSFTGGTDGAEPSGGLILDSVGDIYGTSEGTIAAKGSIFRLSTAGKFTLLHNFGEGGAGGAYPEAALIEDSGGNLYGTASAGGSAGQGTIFKLPKKGKFAVLYSFSGVLDGSDPVAPLILDPAGNLYGTTYLGGSPNCNAYGRDSSCGTVFKLDTKGHRTILHRFTELRKDGDFPSAGLLRDAAGNLYSTTTVGGPAGVGTVFELDPAGNETVLHAFHGPDGAVPFSGLIQDAAGNFYGTTTSGGDFGTVYKLDPQGNETVLYTFTGGDDGLAPFGNLVMDTAGNLYGTTAAGGKSTACFEIEGCGVVFKLDPSGQETVLHSFTGGTDGFEPESALIMDAAGNLYGTTNFGGIVNNECAGGCGVVFKITP